jgi:hypothetical protein
MNSKNLVNADNWTFTGFKSSDLLAFIHLGAEPGPEGKIEMLYLVTLLKSQEEEVFQLEFSSLPQAIDAINERYGHWEFADRSERLDGGGCGTCSAH